MSKYLTLLSCSRLRTTTVLGRNREEEVLSDAGRIVGSTAFRRLQTKAQVFSLERNAAVRTRLTHSLEVATYGQFIAERAFALLEEKSLIEKELRLTFVQTVRNACLLHDIGNPPFGHLGEFAIREWFGKNEAELQRAWIDEGMSAADVDAHWSSFSDFDGNPQGLRIVSRLLWLKDEWGLNLTVSLLASTMKYLGTRADRNREFWKKAGFFETERDRVVSIWKALGLKIDAQSGLPAQRHPLTFLMEAADDIAYCLSDIEDAIEKRICTEREFFEHVEPLLVQLPKEAQDAAADVLAAGGNNPHGFRAKNAGFIEFSRAITRLLTRAAGDSFAKNESAILDGSFSKALLKDDPLATDILGLLKSFAKKKIFVSREAVEVELGGYRIIQTILDGFLALLRLPTSEFLRLAPDAADPPEYGEMALESRLFSLLPNKHWLAYEQARSINVSIEPALRAHLIIDYVTGMTDGFALKVFHMLSGTSHAALEG
jgi:dGTPase